VRGASRNPSISATVGGTTGITGATIMSTDANSRESAPPNSRRQIATAA